MKKTRFIETQIMRALKEGEEGRKTDDICRELEIKATFITGKAVYGGI
ncbi:transposase [Chryseobacterium sp. CKR4-1]